MRSNSRPTPWLWAVNGAADAAAGLAVLMSIAFSISVTLWLGAVFLFAARPGRGVAFSRPRRRTRGGGGRLTNGQVGVCVDPAYQEERQEIFNGKPICFLHRIGSEKCDLILLMDVLEHVDDDVGLLRSALVAAAEHAYVLISVPAFQRLFSAHDRFLEHKRLYAPVKSRRWCAESRPRSACRRRREAKTMGECARS